MTVLLAYDAAMKTTDTAIVEGILNDMEGRGNHHKTAAKIVKVVGIRIRKRSRRRLRKSLAKRA
jgi:hypothetical protein